MFKRIFLLITLILGGAFAQQETITLIINGQTVTVPALIIDGQTYLPLDMLEQAGMLVTREGDSLSVQFGAPITGGTNEIKALEGCMNQFLFNGIWRFQVTAIRSFTEGSVSGWDVDVEMRNGSDRTLSPYDAGVDGTYKGVSLALENGNVLGLYGGDIGSLQNGLVFKELLPGAAAQITFPFRDDGDKAKPVKFLFPIDPQQLSYRAEDMSFATDGPSFRVRLDCGQ